MDTKAAFDREAFEKSAAELIGYKPGFILSQRAGDDYEFGSGLNAYWHFWKESRAAIDIELEQFDEFQMVHYGTTEDYAKGYVDAQINANKAITSHGIRIKGKTE